MPGLTSSLNVVGQCRKYGISLWQCPQFLFLVMGGVIIATSVGTYLIGTVFSADPIVVSLIIICISALLFIISFIIVKSFEKVAEASRMKSEFINIVSHQLRSPITNLKWVVDIITSKDITVSQTKEDEYFKSLEENITRMAELVDDLLIVSRIEQGYLQLRKQETDLNSIIRDTMAQFKFFAEASNVQIDYKTEGKIPVIYCDKSQIKLAIDNLVDNAIKYTKGGGLVAIRLSRKGRKLLFEIQDSGVGIPQADQGYIFQKFFRAENAMKDSTRGSGLGLFITKSIIDKHGGKIWFESISGKGTKFSFLLPIQ